MSTGSSEGNNELGVLRGAQQIAAAIGLPARRAYFLLEAGLLPATKEGNLWVTTRARLQRHYDGKSDSAA
jgi:hypothetical protein